MAMMTAIAKEEDIAVMAVTAIMVTLPMTRAATVTEGVATKWVSTLLAPIADIAVRVARSE